MAETPSRRYQFNAGLHLTPVPGGDSPDRMVHCEIAAASGETIRFVAPDRLIGLLRRFDGQRSIEEVTASAGTSWPAMTREKLQRLIDTFLVPKGVLLDTTAASPQPVARRQRNLYIRKTLLPPEYVVPGAAALQFLFAPRVFAAMASLLLAGQLAFYLSHPGNLILNLSATNGWELTIAVGGSMAAALFHEMGHATAMFRCGGVRPAIGFGLYLYFPVLYTDVSEAWKLPRLDRAVIDAGGMYFQSIVAGAMIGLFLCTGNHAWLSTASFINLSIFVSLNPFLRMDGYWLIADLCGVWDLRKMSRRWAWRLIGRSSKPGGTLARLPVEARLLLPLYTVLSVAFFGWLSFSMGRQIFLRLLPDYPYLLGRTVHEFTHFTATPRAINAFLEWLWKTSMITGSCMFVWRACRASARPWSRWLGKRTHTAKTGLTLTICFLAAGLAVPAAVLGHEIAHLVAGNVLEAPGLWFRSQAVSFAREEVFWNLLRAQDRVHAAQILPLWRSAVFAAAGPVFSCALAIMASSLLRCRSAPSPAAGAVLIALVLMSCLRLTAPASFILNHGAIWAATPGPGLNGGSDEFLFWLASGFPLFLAFLLEGACCLWSLVSIVNWLREQQLAMSAAILLGVAAGVAVYFGA